MLDSDECSVPFNKKSELTGISVISLMPSVRMARMEPLSGAGIISNRYCSLSLRPVCCDVMERAFCPRSLETSVAFKPILALLISRMILRCTVSLVSLPLIVYWNS